MGDMGHMCHMGDTGDMGHMGDTGHMGHMGHMHDKSLLACFASKLEADCNS